MRVVHGWRRALRWILVIAFSVIGLVAGVIVAALIALHTAWGRELVRHQIEAQLRKVFTGGAQVGAFEGSPLSEVVLRGLVIDGPDGKPAISVGQVSVKLGLWPLLGHRLRIDQLIADDVDVAIKREPSGELEVKHLLRPGPPSTWNVALSDVEVHRGHVAVDTGTETIDLDALQIDAAATIPHGGPIDAAVTIGGSYRERRAAIAIAATLHVDDSGLVIPAAAVAIGGVELGAAGVRVLKPELAVVTGTLAIAAPAAAVAALRPAVQLPADLALAIEASPDGEWTQLALAGAIGRAPVRGFARADLAARSARGFVTGSALELGGLSHGKVEGTAGVLASFEIAPGASLPDARAIVVTWGDLAGQPHADAVFSLEAAGDHIGVVGGAATETGLRAGISADVTRAGSALTLDRAVVIANTRELSRATNGKAPVHGALTAKLSAHGALLPELDLAVAGSVAGEALSVKDVAVRALRLQINASHLPAHPTGTARLQISDLKRGDLWLSELTIAAGDRPDGKLQVSVRTTPKQAPWLVIADALVTPGPTWLVDLQRHYVRASGGAIWEGNSGHLEIGPKQIELRDLRTTSRGGTFAVAATYDRRGGDLTAKIDGGLELSNLDAKYSGRFDTHVDVERKAGVLSGTVTAKAAGVGSKDHVGVSVDADAKIDARAGNVTAAVHVSSLTLGAAQLAIDVDAPRDLANVAGWRALGHAAIRKVELTLQRLDLRAIGKVAGVAGLEGKIDGHVAITQTATDGDIAIRGVRAKQMRGLGPFDADLRFQSSSATEISTTLAASLGGVGGATVEVNVTTPSRIFDPAAWRQLGPNAMHGASLRINEIAFDPGTFERLGIVSPVHGKVAAAVDVAEGFRSATLAIDLRELRGGPLADPISAHLDAAIDSTSTRATLQIRAHDTMLMQGTSQLAITLAQLRADPRSALNAKLEATATIPSVPAKALLAVLGTSQITAGVLDGKIAFAGTLRKPTAKASIIATDVTVPNQSRRPVQGLSKLDVEATWDGAGGKVAVTADETGGGKLALAAEGRPDALKDVTANINATSLDLAPLVAFMPGPAGAVTGQLEAKLAVHGVDPRSADVSGSLHITNGRIPIAPAIGTLFHGDLKVEIANHVVDVKMTGKVGGGTVDLAAKVPLGGFAPTGGDATLTVRKVKLIGTTQPVIDAVIAANVARANDTWNAQIHVQHAKVVIPDDKGDPLAPIGTPEDVSYGLRRTYHKPTPVGAKGAPQHRPPPAHPILVAAIDLHDATIESTELRGGIGGKVTVSLDHDAMDIEGDLSLERGDLDLFGRRYTVDRAAIHFDGPPDPMLDVRITYDFPEVTTVTQIGGRISKPDLQLSSVPATYSQAELLGFLIGGEPGGDPNAAPSAADRVAGAGTSYLANAIGGSVRKALPIDIDVLRYESETPMNSAAVTVGTWINRSLFAAYRHHLETRPDENAGEGEIEYWIRRRLVLETTVGDRGYDGIDLLWRRRW